MGGAEWRRNCGGSWGLGKDTSFILERLEAMEYVSREERWMPSVVKGSVSAQWRRDHKRQEQNTVEPVAFPQHLWMLFSFKNRLPKWRGCGGKE